MNRPPRYIWSDSEPDYHQRSSLTERCNTDQLKDRKEGDEPPEGKTLCKHCAAQALAERGVSS